MFKWLISKFYLIFFQRSSVGTVYFSEDVEDAREKVCEILELYDNLLKQLNQDQVKDVTQVIGNSFLD